MDKLEAYLARFDVLVADGATGTELQAQGLPPGQAPEGWNLERPDAIQALHRSYLTAGAHLVYTNTFGGTRIRLEREGLAEQVAAINREAARLAREAAAEFEDRLVFGDMGPTGELLAPLGPLSADEAAAAFAEQAAALAEGGVDAIVIETMSDLNEARAAVEGARFACGLPLLVSMSFDTRGRTMMGVKPEDAARELWALDIAAIGANCGRTLEETLAAVRAMREAVPEALLLAKPNAGLPRTEGDDLIYDVTPEAMAEYARRYVAEAGVRIFGGCCGSTPAHIAAIAEALRE